MLRTALLADIPALLKLEENSFKEEDRFSREQFYYAIKKSKSYFRVYEEDNSIKGYIYLLKTGRVYSLAVLPNKGIGTLLLRRAEDVVRTFLNKKIIHLEVRKDNINALNFYIKNCYNPTFIRYNYYKDGMDAILMQKELLDHAKG